MTTIINCFPGYESVYDEKKKEYCNIYRGTDVGHGGYIYGQEGMYQNVALLDIASMHPTSAITMNCFGKYTKNFKELMDLRIAIKHRDYDTARRMFNGRLAKYLNDESTAKDLAQAAKIAINSVYGLTSAKFDNPFRDIRNKNNIVALKGALFMRTLQDEVTQRGFVVASIRTDSIKIPDATPEIIEFCMDFATKYGYTFEHECTYDRMCLANKSAYIAKYASSEQCEKLYGYVPSDNAKHGGEWTATATQFQVPYVFKKLFSKEKIEFDDLCETKEVKTAIYLDMNENLTVNEEAERELAERIKLGENPDVESDYIVYINPTFMNVTTKELVKTVEKGHNRAFIGKVGQFCPIKPGCGGGILLRKQGDKFDAVTGTKGYRWLESEMVRELGKEADIDRSYYDKLVDDAVDTISKYGDFEMFAAD